MAIKEAKIEVGKLEWFYRHTELESDKPPVLFLHGIPTHSYTWRMVMENLAASGISSFAPDWIGCGFSAKPDKREFAYTPEAYIKALGELVAALELKEFYLVVQGFLGTVGVQYALQNPEQVTKLVILNAPIAADSKLPWGMKQWTIPFVGDMLTQDPLQIDKTLEKGSGFVIEDGALAVHRQPFLETSAVGRALIAIAKNLQLPQSTTEITEGLAKTQLPTLLLWGTEDPWLDFAGVEAIAKSNSLVELAKLTEAKHYPQEHWPKEITEEITQFFRRQIL